MNISERKKQRIANLLIDNPNMPYYVFKQITGLSKKVYQEFKKELGLDCDIGLKYEVKQRFLREMKQRMKEKYGFINLKDTPLQRTERCWVKKFILLKKIV